MKFNFKAKTQEGGYKEGIINANSEEAAIFVLQKNGLLPVYIKKANEGNDILKTVLQYYDRVSEKEMSIFFRQLAILIEARVPIVISLTAIQEQTTNEFLSKVIGDMIHDLEDGMSFSSSMEKQKDVFSVLSINMIKAGETSGNLKKSIDHVADNIERNYNLATKVKSALIYPALVLIVFFIVAFLVVSFIVPNLVGVIKQLDAVIPWYTQIIIVISDFMEVYWWAVAIIIIGILSGVIYYIKTEEGKKEWDQVKIKLPIFGPLFRYIYITRFAENLAILLAGGIPIIKALTITSAVVNNIVYKKIFLEAAEEVKRGGNMSSVLRKNELIPSMVSHMVKIGEDSGQIDSVLLHVANFFEQEVEAITKNLSALIEPVLVVLIGLAVGFMAFAILMPIYNIAGQIQ